MSIRDEIDALPKKPTLSEYTSKNGKTFRIGAWAAAETAYECKWREMAERLLREWMEHSPCPAWCAVRANTKAYLAKREAE